MYPPTFPIVALDAYVPIVRSRNVINNTINRTFITPFKPNEAIIRIPVNIVHASRNNPVALYACDAGSPPAIECT